MCVNLFLICYPLFSSSNCAIEMNFRIESNMIHANVTLSCRKSEKRCSNISANRRSEYTLRGERKSGKIYVISSDQVYNTGSSLINLCKFVR